MPEGVSLYPYKGQFNPPFDIEISPYDSDKAGRL